MAWDLTTSRGVVLLFFLFFICTHAAAWVASLNLTLKLLCQNINFARAIKERTTKVCQKITTKMNLDFFWQFNHRQTDLTFIVKFCRFETFQVCWSMIFCRKQRTRRAIGTNYNYSGFFFTTIWLFACFFILIFVQNFSLKLLCAADFCLLQTMKFLFSFVIMPKSFIVSLSFECVNCSGWSLFGFSHSLGSLGWVVVKSLCFSLFPTSICIARGFTHR